MKGTVLRKLSLQSSLTCLPLFGRTGVEIQEHRWSFEGGQIMKRSYPQGKDTGWFSLPPWHVVVILEFACIICGYLKAGMIIYFPSKITAWPLASVTNTRF